MPRKTSDVTDTEFPFVEDTVPFILVFNLETSQAASPAVAALGDKELNRGYAAAWTGEKKYDLVLLATDLQEAGITCTLLATWPGATATHVFEVDDLNEARDALG
jgi:hypothetical protein